MCARIMNGLNAPAPIMVSVLLSGRDKYVEAKAEAAAVRQTVIRAPSIVAKGCPVWPSIK